MWRSPARCVFTREMGAVSAQRPPSPYPTQASATAADALEDTDSTRVFKFGAASQVRSGAAREKPAALQGSAVAPPWRMQSDFERWSRCLRAAIDSLGRAAKAGVLTSQALEAATNAGDLFRAAIASPKDRQHRRAPGVASALMHRGEVAVGSGSGCTVGRAGREASPVSCHTAAPRVRPSLQLSFELLDGSKTSIVVGGGEAGCGPRQHPAPPLHFPRPLHALHWHWQARRSRTRSSSSATSSASRRTRTTRSSCGSVTRMARMCVSLPTLPGAI